METIIEVMETKILLLAEHVTVFFLLDPTQQYLMILKNPGTPAMPLLPNYGSKGRARPCASGLLPPQGKQSPTSPHLASARAMAHT